MKYLNDNSIPILYNIYFKININDDLFSGLNKIKLNIIKPTNQIQFHAEHLNIEQINIIDLIISNIIFDYENCIFTIVTTTMIDVGYIELLIKFNGKITDNYGLIKHHHASTDRTVFYTKFEPISARRCYPCWDEPKYKVKYLISISINDPSYLVLANTDPLTIDNISDDNILYKFDETIPMSSYLSSFIIAKMNFIEAISKHNIRLRVYIPSDIEDLECGRFALECGIKMLDFMIDYYSISFPYNKIDFIPINDTAAMGMENYGLIFYDLDFLLFDKKISTLETKIEIARVIAHELAHQWFGNLLSINRWNDIWLKESFANFFETFILDKVYPEWDHYSYNVAKIFKTLDFDSICLNSVRIKHHINNKNIEDIYNKLTYSKGGILLNILLKYIGEEQFKINISNYLNTYKYSVIDTDKFINSISMNLNRVKQDNIRLLVNQYINNNGYPIIKIINNKISFVPFNSINFIKNKIAKNNIFDYSIINNWQISINISNDKFIICNSNSNTITDHQHIINNKNYSYFRILYNEEQFKFVLDSIQNDSSHQHMSILNDLYTLGIYLICPFEYWLIYINCLINLLLSYNDCCQFNYYLISMIYKSIDNIKKIKRSNKIDKLLINPLEQLIDKLYNMFDIFNIDIYLGQDLISNDMNRNQLVFFLIGIESDRSTKLINKMFDNKLFNLYADLNYTIIKRIIINNDTIRLGRFNNIIDEFSFMYEIIENSLKYTTNEKAIHTLLKKHTSNLENINYYFITDLLDENKYFLSIFTSYFLANFEHNYNIYSKNVLSFNNLVDKLIGNQSNYKIISILLDKFKNIDSIRITETKYFLFNKLYLKNNLNKLLDNI